MWDGGHGTGAAAGASPALTRPTERAPPRPRLLELPCAARAQSLCSPHYYVKMSVISYNITTTTHCTTRALPVVGTFACCQV